MLRSRAPSGAGNFRPLMYILWLICSVLRPVHSCGTGFRANGPRVFGVVVLEHRLPPAPSFHHADAGGLQPCRVLLARPHHFRARPGQLSDCREPS